MADDAKIEPGFYWVRARRWAAAFPGGPRWTPAKVYTPAIGASAGRLIVTTLSASGTSSKALSDFEIGPRLPPPPQETET